MKNKKLIKDFKIISPSIEEKEIMLDNILNNNKITIPFRKIIPVTLSLLLILVLNINSKVIDKNYEIASLRINNPKLSFIYKNKCYQESNIISSTDNLKKIGIITSLENNELINIPIYQNNNNNILIKLDNHYITFVERNCFDIKERNLK